MKTTIKFFISLLFLFFAFNFIGQSQNTREIIQKAMRDELARNVERLSLEKLKKPFYIAYTIRDLKVMRITASLGALVTSSENPRRDHNVRVMVGDYKRNDENFFETGGSGRNTMLENADRLSLEDDYNGIRRALWIATDNIYKRAAESYERKIAAVEQQKLSTEEAALDDFGKAAKLSFTSPPRTYDFQKSKWEGYAKDMSSLFRDYPDIYSSEVEVRFRQADIYFANTGGTETVYPLTLATIHVNASTQALDGEPLKDHLVYYGITPDDLPSIETVKKEINALAVNLVALRTAPEMDDSYTGPILFEDQAVGELVSQRLFTGSAGLIAARKPIFGDQSVSMFYGQMKKSSFEDKIETRIFTKDISIKAIPSMNKYENTKLIGSFEVDAEGIKPPKELTLVDQGILKTLLSNRVPTPKVKESNGHERPVVGSYGAGSDVGPGVIVLNTSAGKNAAELKKELLRRAKEEGLQYALIVRKLTAPGSGSDDDFDISSIFSMGGMGEEDKGSKLSEPVLVYKVHVSDGKEELLRSVDLGGLGANTLRKIAGVEKKQFAYNTMIPASGAGGFSSMFSFVLSMGGGETFTSIPSSFIVPKSILFEELEVKKEKRSYTPKLPVVPSPLVKK